MLLTWADLAHLFLEGWNPVLFVQDFDGLQGLGEGLSLDEGSLIELVIVEIDEAFYVVVSAADDGHQDVRDVSLHLVVEVDQVAFFLL